MGGDGPRTFDRVVEFCDGWIPIGLEPAAVAKKIAMLRQRAEAAGRDPKQISVSIFGARPERGTFDDYEKAGVERLIFGLPSANEETLLPLLDKLAAIIA